MTHSLGWIDLITLLSHCTGKEIDWIGTTERKGNWTDCTVLNCCARLYYTGQDLVPKWNVKQWVKISKLTSRNVSDFPKS